MSHYRGKLKAEHKRDAVRSSLLKELHRMRSLVKNTLAAEVSHYHADVWLISPGESESVKNTLADAQIIVFANIISPSSPPE